MGNKATVQTEFVVNVFNEVQADQEDNTGDLVFKLVDMAEFTRLFKESYPASTENPERIWRNLFGSEPIGNSEGQYKEVQYLTEDSCRKILQHYKLFISGIDFNHLPSGFFLTKNPNLGGVRDVLHYSEFLAKKIPQKTSLAMILSQKEKKEFELHDFKEPQSQWYEFLRTKMSSADTLDTFCTEEELKKAFITFSNTLQRLGLKFEEPDFSSAFFQGDFNPVVLLGRWDTVLTQPNLKKIDGAKQFKELLFLKLTSGYGALRAISDYSGTENPCGFLVREMFEGSPKYFNVRKEEKHVESEMDFWRYIAYQPQRNSIEYYQKGLQAIAKMDLPYYQRATLYEMLAGSSTGRAHFSKTVEEEAIELEYWKKLCDLIENIDSCTPSMVIITTTLGSMKSDFIRHLGRLKETPNVPFLHSMAHHIKDYIGKLDPISAAAQTLLNISPLASLEKLSNKLNALISDHGADFYEGARFYFVEGEWVKLNVEKYVKLQFHMDMCSPLGNDGSHPYRAVMPPHLSTFNLLNKEDVNEIHELLCQAIRLEPKDFTFCLNLFRDVIKPCSKEDFIKIIREVNNRPEPFDSLMSIIEYVESNFAEVFPKDYFTKKKAELLDTQNGLNEEQIFEIRKLKFSDEQTEFLIRIESALVRRHPETTNAQLNSLNECLANLNRLITEADFTFFLEKLESVKEQLPKDVSVLEKLVQLSSTQRSINDFRQIYYRNKIEKCTDESLIHKFVAFIETIKLKAKVLGSLSVPAVQELLASLTLNTALATVRQPDFTGKIDLIFASIDKVSAAHPHLKNHLLESLNNIPSKQSAQYFDNVSAFIRCIDQISDILPAGKDEVAQKNMLTIYSLLANFYKKPMDLVTLWNKINKLDPKQQKFVLILINKLIENNQDITGIEELINELKTPKSFDLLVAHCSEPPYPSIPVINSWFKGGDFKTSYQNFSMKPYGERRLDFAFDSKKFNTQKELFKGQNDDLFTDKLAQEIEKKITKNRQLSVQKLRKQFAALKSSAKALTEQQKLELLCTCIEMLARTTAQLDDSTPPKIISQELNATQIMALYAMLTNSKSKLISEIGTGEGKSRITMILAACQVAQGKTVDFLTSDMQLAERDFLTYNTFFTSLGIRSSLISLNTPKQLYQKGGINFTDNSQLLLLRNWSDIRLKSYAFLEKDPEKRCVLIDEVDKFVHDRSKDSYNYAAPSKTLKTFTWVYPIVVDFVRETLKSNPDIPFKAESLIKNFLDYVAIHDTDELHQACVAALEKDHKNQLITWLDSAHTALHMKEDDDYKVSEDKDDKLVCVRDADGFTRYTRQIMVLDSGRPVEGATFALGVHQCLCAIENQKAGKEAFVLLPENEVQRSSFPVTFIDQYNKGAVYGVSGTARYEAPTAKAEINYEEYAYLVVPRHKGVRREDKNIWLAKNEEQQIKFLKKELRQKLKKTPPESALLICRNDQQSKVIHEALLADEEFMKLVKKCTRVHGLTEKTEEVKAVKEAGEEATITISTVGMFGRGVDINSPNLWVTALYVPTFEDEKQIKGRTGRAGKQGEYRMILNQIDPDSPIKPHAHDVTNQVDKIQKKMAVQAVNQEEIAKLYAGFLENIHQNFLNSYQSTPKLKQLDLLLAWQNYLSEVQKAWNVKKEEFLYNIEHAEVEEFTKGFNAFSAEWETKADFIKGDKPAFSPEKAETIYQALKHQKTFFKESPRKPLKAQKKYDPSDDGQPRIYSSLFAQERAVLKGQRPLFADIKAWREGRGELFPDLMATLRGERPLFADLRATINRLIQEWKANRLAKKEQKKPKEPTPAAPPESSEHSASSPKPKPFKDPTY
jgi:preprotein translocase subunit SecA